MSNDWIEHNGGPQPVDDDVWVEVKQLNREDKFDLARWIEWDYKILYRILNQHLIDAKQAEIDALQHEVMWLHNALEQTEEAVVYGYTLLDDMDAKIDAARLEGIRLGLEAAAKEVGAGRWRWSTWEENERMGEWAIRLQNVYKHCELLIHNLNPDTIARDVQTSSHQEKCDDLHIAREAVLDQLTSEAQADNMGYDKETAR